MKPPYQYNQVLIKSLLVAAGNVGEQVNKICVIMVTEDHFMQIKLSVLCLYLLDFAPVLNSVFCCVLDQGTGPRVSGLYGSAGF